MSNDEDFVRHRIDQLGISIEFYRGWPVESIIDGKGKNIYQRIADTGGLVFVRYGDNQTIPDLLKTLTDLITTVSIVSDELTTVGRNNARHVTLIQERSSVGVHLPRDSAGYVHEHLPEARNVMSVFSFTHRGIPILVGYRVPEQVLPSYRSILERIIESVDTINDET